MCFIIPPQIYNNLLANGDADDKSFATLALAEMHKFAVDPAKMLEEYLKRLVPFEAEEEVVNRAIYDAEHKMKLPGKLVRKEGEGSNGDAAVDDAYDGAGWTYEFFQKIYGRNSIDNKGMELINTVHYGKNFGNAFWNSRQMVFGDGDNHDGNGVFNKFTLLDICGHEISHGITERSAGLVYEAQPGALNESFSDVFGCLIKQYSLGQTADKADWLVGEGLFGSTIKARALRDMRAPGTAYDDPKIGRDRQTDHMDRYDKSSYDNFCVHINSGIPNKAFATAAMNVGGFAWEKMGRVWYQVLTKELKPKSQFQDAANATVKVAKKLYGDKSVECAAIIDGWKTVGISPKV